MKIIRDLMDAYSEYVELPLVLVNLGNEIEYKIKGRDYLYAFNESTESLAELQRISLHLNNPTVVSITDDLYISGVFYIITPVFEVNAAHYFLAAGPFRETLIMNSSKDSSKDDSVRELSEEQIEEKISKVRKLHHIAVSKSLTENNISIPTQIMDILRLLGDFECDIGDYGQYIKIVSDKLLKMEVFDFFGLALKNEDDVFVIKYVSGKRIEQLTDKRFYIGEGLLGKAVILGEDFYWDKKTDTQRVDFFNRYGIFPEHLFGFVLKQENNVTGVLFGGNFKEAIINDHLLNLIKCIVRFISQRKNIDAKLLDSYSIQTIFANWLDLIDVALQIDDKKYMAYRVLDFCQILNKERFSCVTTNQGDFIYRGEIYNGAIECHQKMIDDGFRRQTKIWTDGIFIHFSLPLYGMFTVAFHQNTNLEQASYILSMLEKVLKQNNEPEVITAVQGDSIFGLLYSSMEIMNKAKYDVANSAKKLMGQLVEEFQISSSISARLVTICSVLPFEEAYLEKHIAHTEEWGIFLRAMKLLDGRLLEEETTLEVKLLAFVYGVIFACKQGHEMVFLTADMRERCISIYRLSVQENEQLHPTMKVDIDHDAIEEIVDVKNVIASLNLTSREKEILYLILEGLNNYEVGEYLKISVHTVKNHVTNLFKKLNVSDRMQAMTKIYRIKYGEDKL